MSLIVADGDVLNVGIVGIVFADFGIVWTVQRQNKGAPGEAGKYESLGGLHVNEIALLQGIGGGPGRVVKLFEPGKLGLLDGPLGVLVEPAAFGLDGGFAVGIDHDIHVGLF